MSQPRIIQPLVIMAPPEPADLEDVADDEAQRFIEDTAVESNLTFQQWVAKNKPLPPTSAAVGIDLSGDVPDD